MLNNWYLILCRYKGGLHTVNVTHCVSLLKKHWVNVASYLIIGNHLLEALN